MTMPMCPKHRDTKLVTSRGYVPVYYCEECDRQVATVGDGSKEKIDAYCPRCSTSFRDKQKAKRQLELRTFTYCPRCLYRKVTDAVE